MRQGHRKHSELYSRSASNAFSKLVTKIQSLERTKRLAIEHDDKLQLTMDWIRRHQHPRGYWGYESVADTAFVLLSLASWGVADSTWEIYEGTKGGIDVAVAWLKKNQRFDNWDNNIWDTSMVVRALVRNGIYEEWVHRALTWIENQEQGMWGIRYGTPVHHASQALCAMVEAGSLESKVARCREAVLRALEDHAEEYSPYALGQAIEALICSGVNPSLPTITKIVDRLKSFVEHERMTEGTFQDIVFGFAGISSLLSDPKDALVRRVADEMFASPERLKPDGSWYNDAKKTSHALYALRKLKEVSRIDVAPYALYNMISEAEAEVQGETTAILAESLRALVYLGSLSGLVILIIVLIVTNIATQNFYTETIFGVLIGAPFAYLGRKLFLLIRKLLRLRKENVRRG